MESISTFHLNGSRRMEGRKEGRNCRQLVVVGQPPTLTSYQMDRHTDRRTAKEGKKKIDSSQGKGEARA